MGELGCDLALEKAGDFLECRRRTLELGKLLQANPILCLAFHPTSAGSGQTYSLAMFAAVEIRLR